MLGVAPNDKGLLDDADVNRLHELGDAIRTRYANNLSKQHLPTDDNTAQALDGDPDTFWSAPAGSHTAALEVHFARPITFDHALTMEWLPEGQNVLQYRIEVWQNGQWKSVVSDYAIGHEKIDHFPPVTSQRVRLHIIASAGDARIREFQLFSIPSVKP